MNFIYAHLTEKITELLVQYLYLLDEGLRLALALQAWIDSA